MEHITLVTRQLGLHATHKGYRYLIDSIQMALENERNLILFSKTIFPKIAQTYDTDAASVERNIRTLVDFCWNSPFQEKLQEISLYHLEKKPTVGEFIDILYWYVKCLEES